MPASVCVAGHRCKVTTGHRIVTRYPYPPVPVPATRAGYPYPVLLTRYTNPVPYIGLCPSHCTLSPKKTMEYTWNMSYIPHISRRYFPRIYVEYTWNCPYIPHIFGDYSESSYILSRIKVEYIPRQKDGQRYPRCSLTLFLAQASCIYENNASFH